MQAFIAMLTKRQVHPSVLFLEAFDYWEMRFSVAQKQSIFVHCLHKAEDGKIYLQTVPKFVEDYCKWKGEENA